MWLNPHIREAGNINIILLGRLLIRIAATGETRIIFKVLTQTFFSS